MGERAPDFWGSKKSYLNLSELCPHSEYFFWGSVILAIGQAILAFINAFLE